MNWATMSIIKQAVSYMLSVLLIGTILSGSSWSASAQECPVLFSPLEVAPSQAYDYSSPAFRSLFSSLKSMIKHYTSHHRISSYAVTIVHENRTIFSFGLTRTPFRIASITKTFTALGAFILREQGRLLLDDPVKKFLPSFSIINPFDEQQHDTTLRELMGHAAGFPQQLCPFLMTCTDDEAEILEQISEMQLISPPWSEFPAYSNLGIALLGRAWEKATIPSVSWEDFVTENIIKPLGMTQSGVDVTGVELAPNSHPWALQDLGWSAPAAQMYSTADDLAKYLAFLLTAQPPLISPNSIREWTSPATIFPDGKGGYSFPWELQELHEHSPDFLLTKGGNINGYVSHLAFDPPTHLGVVVLTVLEGGISSGSPDELAGDILRTLIPRVQSVNQEMIADVYAGVYTCPASKAFASPNWDFKVLVRDGTINVSVSPTVGLLADVRIDLLNGGIPFTTTGTWALLLKNETENSFWFGDGSSCNGIVGAVSAGPDLKHPNVPGSLYSNVVVFDPVNGSVQLPALGGRCYKAGFEPSHHQPRTSFFMTAIYSFFVYFFAF